MAFHRRLTGSDKQARIEAARAWSRWEGETLSIKGPVTTPPRFNEDDFVDAFARIECHYFMHDAFLRANQLIDDAGRLSGIPGVIVHGRYDAICPLENAWELHHAWPGSELSIIADAGHSAAESGTRSRLVEATDLFAGVD